jgi:hypothetical protein
MATQLLETIEQAFTNYIPDQIVHALNPYILGASATVLGIVLGSLYTDNESFIEFQTYMDKESHLKEMNELFLKKDQFLDSIKVLIFILILLFSIAVLFGILLAVKVFRFNKSVSLSLVKIEERFQNTETVIESILKDNEIVDVEKLQFFKKEVEQQRSAFNDLIANKSLELETKISNAKSACLKIKTTVHGDMVKTQNLVEKIDTFKPNLTNISETLIKTKATSELLETDIANFTKNMTQKMDEAEANVEQKFKNLNMKLTDQDVDIFKCNALLVNSRILLEAAVSKFESIECINNNADLTSSHQERIIACLKTATEITDYFKTQDNVNIDTASSKLLSELPLTTGYLEKDPYKNSINTLLFEFMKRLSLIEEKLSTYNLLINNNSKEIKKLDLTTDNKISDLKFYSDEWITSWVSVIYGLFNSSFLHLENQLFGIDCLEYTTIFDVSNPELDDNSQLFYEIMDQCKQTSLKIIKEVNLLIFEYYLVQKSYTNNRSSLLNMCNTKIDEELDDLFKHFEISILASKVPKAKQGNIINTLFKLKHDLCSDLKGDTQRFNELVKQNLDDFYIIHDTMKSILKETSTSDIRNEYDLGHDDSIIEISEYSNSLLSSSHEESSFSESDSSILPENFSESSLKPFKLTSSLIKNKKIVRSCS